MKKLKKSDYKILNQKILTKTAIFEIIKTKLRLPNDKIVERYNISGKEVVAAVVINDKGEVILNREFRIVAKDLILEIPAGKTDAKSEIERIKELNRELQEEVGVKGKKIEKLVSALRGPHNNRRVHIYLVRDLEKSRLPADSGELIETIKLPIDKAIEVVMNEKQPTTFETIAGLLLAKSRLLNS
jgi:ADP-ribose pyrophosphatase